MFCVKRYVSQNPSLQNNRFRLYHLVYTTGFVRVGRSYDHHVRWSWRYIKCYPPGSWIHTRLFGWIHTRLLGWIHYTGSLVGFTTDSIGWIQIRLWGWIHNRLLVWIPIRLLGLIHIKLLGWIHNRLKWLDTHQAQRLDSQKAPLLDSHGCFMLKFIWSPLSYNTTAKTWSI